MTRMLTAACLVLGGLVSSAPAQVYTSYYAPSTSYYHAPPYSYSAYSYSSNYGPLRVFDPRWWAGTPPYTAGYSSPYATTYTAGYYPASSTSYYSPTVDTAVAYYSAPAIGVSNACCPTTCCAPCGTDCATCTGGNCPGGNCAMNYAPSDMSPQPDPASSGSSGTKTFESESGNDSNRGSANPGTGTQDQNQGDDFREPYNRDVPDDGFSGSRGTGYRPEQRIEQKAPTDLSDEAGPEAAGKPNVEEPEAGDEPLSAPGSGEPDAAAPLLNLDTKISQAPSRFPGRHSLRARFGSPSLARAEVDPATIPNAEKLQLVRK